MYGLPPYKRQRRTATSVCAGVFDPRPSRDVLTSLLNGGVPLKVEEEEEVRRARKKERREVKAKHDAEKDRRRAHAASKAKEKSIATANTSHSASAPPNASGARSVVAPKPVNTPSLFWQARPSIHIQTNQRSVSVTPPPMPSSPPTTPGPSVSSGTSATSSKRLRTPEDDEEIGARARTQETSTPPPAPQPRKKRVAARKGWKGWVEGSPPPSEKLINLDTVNVLTERKTRSGKSFDAIGVGKEGWV